MDVVGFAAKFIPCAAHLARHRGKQVSKKGQVSTTKSIAIPAWDLYVILDL
jgi:hypothetical protein